MWTLPELNLAELKIAAKEFASQLNNRAIPSLFGATDGKAVGTYVEQEFRRYLSERYSFTLGNAAAGIDFPGLNVDIKTTSTRQPQSSCPFSSASQKVYGLGYHLLIFEYEKSDNPVSRAAILRVVNVIFLEKERTADYQTTVGLLGILQRNGNVDDIVAFLEERNLPLDEIGCRTLAERIIAEPPKLGYLTISNALQWRLQYTRAITFAINGKTEGVESLYV
jgi:hypothetical protein